MKISEFLTSARETIYAYNHMCEPILLKYDIPQVSFDILMFLTNHPEFCTAQEISEWRNIKKNLVSVHVDKLVTAGLLERNIVPGDRRKVALSCTEKAEPIIKEGAALQQFFFERLTEGISEEDWAVYKRISSIIENNKKEIQRRHE